MENSVIKVLNRRHGLKVLNYFDLQGIDTANFWGNCTEESNGIAIYYGVINGKFSNYTLEEVKAYNAKIIELPIENSRPFPRLMLVRRLPFGNPSYSTHTRVVVATGDGYAVAVKDCETWDDYIKLQKAGELDYTLWKYHQEIPNKVIISKAEIAEKFGIPIDLIKIVD